MTAERGGDRPLRVLALDHYFDQDLKALEAHPALDVRRVPFERLRRPAIRIMGEEVATGLEAFARPDLESVRQRYAAWLRKAVRRMYLERSFDVFVLPTDTFFYVRALPDVLHALGLPVVVVQKETTLSDEWLTRFSAKVREHAPFIADRATVCSERQKEFWVRAGADPSDVVITGQPRFDTYAGGPSLTDFPERRVLFLSYALDTYVNDEDFGRGLKFWESLRTETESALVDAARAGVRITIKLHPQQDREGEIERLTAMAPDVTGRTLHVPSPEADTRDLILDCDTVVGFQTTGLYEAVAAGRHAIYAAWGPVWEERRGELLPFEDSPPECLDHATSKEHLLSLLSGARPEPPPTKCTAWHADALGPVDGGATDRVAQVLVSMAATWPPGHARAALDERRRGFAARMLIAAAARECLWAVARYPARVVGKDVGAVARRRLARERRRMAREGLRGRRAER